MDKELFLFILSNQQIWAEQFKEQQHILRREKNEKCILSNWYGRSKEYKKLWRKHGAQINK